MTGLFRTRQPFLQTNSWQNQALNSLRYNTSQPGSVIPIIIGQVRQQVNVIDIANYMGPQGKKGKVGPLPLTGTPNASKGGGSSKGKGSKKSGTGKKSGNFSLDVMFGMAQGPIAYPNANLVFSSSGVENFNQSQLNFYPGYDGQAGDPKFISLGHTVNYSGTCVVSGTPLNLGSSPVLPNLGLELQSADDPGTGGVNFSLDECPGNAIYKILTNLRYGAGFPVQNLSEIRAVNANTYGDYCQAAQLAISTSLDGQQKCIDWLDAIVRLTNSELVWSGSLLKIIPHGDMGLAANGAIWTPNLSPAYALTDDDFLPWDNEEPGSGPKPGKLDPILVTRTNPNDAINWMGIEYLDRSNYYNPTVIPVFDQGSIDTYGLKMGETIQGRAFCNSTSAQVSAQLKLQRVQYIRNSPYKFKLGWKYSLLEPMDIVTLTGPTDSGDVYLVNQPVRILQLEEGEDGGFTIDAEEVPVVTVGVPRRPSTTGTILWMIPGPVPTPIYNDPFGHVSSVTFPGPDNAMFYPRGAVIIATIVSRSASSVDSITDTLSLTWNRRFKIYNSTIGATLEVWWADTSAVPASTEDTVTVNFAGTAFMPSVAITSVTGAGLVNPASPWDTNGSLPASVTDTAVTPTIGGISTSAPTAMLIAWIVTTDPSLGFVIIGGNEPQWGTSGITTNFYGSKLTGEYLNYAFVASDAPPLYAGRIQQTFSNYTATPFTIGTTGNTAINPAGGQYMLVVDAIAGG